MSDITSLFGGPTGARSPNEELVEEIEEILEKARSGEIVGLAGAAVYFDGAAAWHAGGTIGGYSLVGALEAAKTVISRVNIGDVD